MRAGRKAAGEALKNKLIETAVRPKWDSGKELPEWDVTYQEHPPNQNPSSSQL